MSTVNYTYKVISKDPVTDEQWEIISKDGDIDMFHQRDFVELIVETEMYGKMNVFCHTSVAEDDDKIKETITHQIKSRHGTQ